MKKISLVLCFALMLVLLFAFNAFAATQNNITKDAELDNDGSTSDLIDQSKVVDGNYNTASSCGDAGEDWVNYRFFYDEGVTVSKVRVILNSTGTLSNGTVYEKMSTNKFTFFVRLYMANNSDTYYNKSFDSTDMNVVKEYKDAEGNVLYTYFEIEFAEPVANVYQVEVPVVNNKNADVGLWEVEIYNYVCTEEDEHEYTEVTCATPETCIYCGATRGKPNEELHVWKNASYTEPETCRLCGEQRGVAWTDSDLPSFTRGPENEKITYEDIIGDIILYTGSTTWGEITDSLDGNYSTWWGGCGSWNDFKQCPTHSESASIKIVFKNEWEITDAKMVAAGNYVGYKIEFFAADNTSLGTHSNGGFQLNSDFCNSKGDATNAARETFSNATIIKNKNYYDNDEAKAVKYVIFTITSSKWQYLPIVAEFEFYGRERIPAECSHEFEEKIVKAPTCLEGGIVQNVCKKCEAAEGEVKVPALGHKIGDYTIIVDPTCNKAPKIEYVCANGCGETFQTEATVDDVTDNYVPYSENGHTGGGYNFKSIFDNNMDTCSLAPGDWYTWESVELDRAYYISSATVWVGNARYDSAGNKNTTIILYYQAPGSDEWIEAGRTAGNGTYMSVKYDYILELDEPVYADAVMVRVEGLESWNGCVWEAKVSGSIVKDVATGHTWKSYETVAPDCDDFGYTNYICTVCDAEKKSDPVEETGHVWAAATCLAPKTCTVCAATEGDAAGHVYDDNANDATCNREGCDYVRGIARIGEQYFATLADAFNTAVEGDEIVVLDKIVVEGEATWNLTGKTITFVNSPADNYAVVVKGDLTIVGGTYNVTGYFGFGVTGKLTVKGGTFVAETADYLIGSWGTTTINGGSFKANYNCVNAFAGSVVINGGNFEVIDVTNTEWPAQDVFGEGVGTAVIYGGTFSTDIHEYLAETYHIDLDENGKYVAAPTTHVDAKAATCTANGNVEYWYCETCELVWVDKALTRISNFKSVVTPAAHSYTYACDKICCVCYELTNEAAEHTIEKVEAKAATCTENGNKEYYNCTICGYAWLDEDCTQVANQRNVVVPAAHSYTYACDKICCVCYELTNEAAEHTIEKVEAKAATCTENGNKEYYNCTICGYAWLDEDCTQVANQRNVVVPATDHDNASFEIITEPTCTEPGSKNIICSACGEVVDTEEIPATGHNYTSEIVKSATCVENGIETYTCSACGDSYDQELIADLDDYNVHNYWYHSEVPATCQTAGTYTEICHFCRNMLTVDVPADPENGHDWVNNVYKAATCIAEGYRDRTCSICNANEAGPIEIDIDYGHDLVVEEKLPTCKDDGYHKETCKLCDYEDGYSIPASEWAHDYENLNGGLLQVCSICGASQLNYKEMEGTDNDYYAAFAYDGTALNIYTADYSYDVYYNMEIISNENGVYVISLSMDEDVLGFNGQTAVLTLVENGGTLVITAADSTVYTFNYEALDYNRIINGTFESADGSVKIEFKDGVATVLKNEAGLNLGESFTYNYNPMIGVVAADVPLNITYSLDEDAIYIGRNPLYRAAEGGDEEPEVNYGNVIGSITVETTDTHTFDADSYTYTADKAGQYSFFIPAGLSFHSNKADQPEIDFNLQPQGGFAVVDLAAGETITYSLMAATKQEWTIQVYYYTEHTHTEVEIPAVLPTPSKTGYTAGIECSECGETIKAPVEIKVTEEKNDNFKIASASLTMQENISVNYYTIVKAEAGYDRENAYIVFLFNGEEFIVDEYTVDSQGRLKFKFREMLPQKMADRIDAYLYSETADGEYSMNKVENYSVMQYAINMINKSSTTDSEKTAMADLLVYGAKTQLYVGYRTDKLVTDLVAAQGITLNPSQLDKIPDSANVQSLTGDRTQGADWNSGKLVFDDATFVKLIFTASDEMVSNGLVAKIEVAGTTKYFDVSELPKDEKGRYVITIDYIAAYQFGETITATFEIDDAQVGSVLTYSINSFLYRNYDKTDKDKVETDLYKALYLYGESVKKNYA